MRKAMVGIAVALVVLFFYGTGYAASVSLDFPVYASWVDDENSGACFTILGKQNGADSGMTYQWSGNSVDGYADGKGVVKICKYGELVGSYSGTYEKGVMQGHFLGLGASGKRYMEWNCVDGEFDGPIIITMDKDRIDLTVENNRVASLVGWLGDAFMEILFENANTAYGKIETSGASYEGSFNKNGINGYGVLKYKDGGVYEGQFTDSKQTGHGKMTYANGTVYVGDFVDGQCHGYGTYYDSEGNILRQGRWENHAFVE